MNILLINHYAGSTTYGMEFRPYYLAREWVRLGHKVRIVAASFAHVRTHQPQAELVNSCETVDGIEYQWLQAPAYSGNSARRAINIFTFAGRLLKASRRLARDFQPDIVIASSTHPFDIYGAERIARLSKARLVFEIHDLWPLSPIELGGMSPYHPFILAIGASEQRALRTADVVVSILPVTKEYLVGRGMAPEKFFHVPNGIDVTEWEGDPLPLPAPHAAILKHLKEQRKFIVGYAGAHGTANQLSHALAAAVQSKDDQVHFVLVGHGPEKSALISESKRLGLKNITFLDPVPKTLIPSLLSEFDLLYFAMKKEKLYRFGISLNKLMDYMMAAKPIVQAVEAGNDPVRDAGCGVTIAPDEPAALLNAISQLKQTSHSEINAMGQRGRAYALAHHDYRILAKQFLKAAVGTKQSDTVTNSTDRNSSTSANISP